jgi:hypothetical protein
MDADPQKRARTIARVAAVIAILLAITAMVLSYTKSGRFNPTPLGGLVIGVIVVAVTRRRR